MRVMALVMILLFSIIPISSEATSGRALNTEIVMNESIWTSSDSVQAEIYVSGAPFNRDIILNWELSDENALIVNGTELFQMGGSTHIIQLSLSQLY